MTRAGWPMGYERLDKGKRRRGSDTEYSRRLTGVAKRKQMEKRLQDAERLAAIGEVAGMVGHDLRNPLEAIVNRLYLAEKALESLSHNDSQVIMKLGLKKLFEELGEQVKYMGKVVSDLQDYARPMHPRPVEIRLSELLDDAFSMFRVPETVKVIREIDENFILKVDPNLMVRLLTNLLTNAVQAMPNGGRLAIKSLKKKDTLLISIQDTGVGISREDTGRLFTPFFTTKAGGTGLGLSVCRRVAEAHNGNIAFESLIGEGSTFTIELPLKRGDEPSELDQRTVS